MSLKCFLGIIVILFLVNPSVVFGQQLPDWTRKIHSDHPRLFFNTDTWPEVRKRALGDEREWYLRFKRRVDNLAEDLANDANPEPRDRGQQAAWSAFVYLVTEEPEYLELAKKCIDTSIRYYDACFQQRKAVDWYSTSRVHTALAWDWLYNDLTQDERHEYMSRLVRAVDNVMKAEPRIYRENISGYDTGFYGVNNSLWFIGCTAFGAGIEPDIVNEWLVWGYNENMKMLEHRKKACGDDGGGASPTLGYIFGEYPWSEQNFFYTWLSSTGENIAPDWPHSALLANYFIWNWVSAQPAPLELGYGDTPHTHNRLPVRQMYTHMANVQHLYSKKEPEAAALARYVQEMLPDRYKSYSRNWFIYPFLLLNLHEAPKPFLPQNLPHGRHFEQMGQIFMRSGTGNDDTYCMFSCGGILRQHRHYDALNFVIYREGFLALDSGTRYKQFDNGQHLANYYAQTVAHNCVLIHQPGEPPANYWGGSVEGNYGGQHSQLGSVVKAFETNDNYVYAAGDATQCYKHGIIKREGQSDLPEKCDLVTRQLVFLMPNHFVIFDRVQVTDPSYRKEWLIHTAHKPTVEDKTIRADHEGGRMFCQTLLPADAFLVAVGGPGKKFWASDKNWALVTEGLEPENLATIGQWRVEVAPGKPRKNDTFLHVIQVGDQTLESMDEIELIEGDDVCGVRLITEEQTWEVTFNKTGELGGHIKRIGGEQDINRELTVEIQRQVGIQTKR
ncbi:heparinase II/III family protein [Candidatus Poribacteria bacterium]